MAVLEKLIALSGSAWREAGAMFPAFAQPLWLLLAPPLCLLAWAMTMGSLSMRTGPGLSRARALLLCRCALLAGLCMVLAEPRLRWKTDQVAVIAVLDVSESVPPEQRQKAESFLRSSLDLRTGRDRFGMVTVAREPVVQSLATWVSPRVEMGSLGLRDASCLDRGLEVAFSLIPPETAGRVLLISDGNQTQGNIEAAAGRLRVAGVPIDVACIEYDRTNMVRMEQVAAPAWAREGETVPVRIVLNAGVPVAGRLTLLLDGEAIDLSEDAAAISARVKLDKGTRVFTLPMTLPSGAAHRIEAIFEPDNAAAGIASQLRGQAVTFTSNQGRVLVLTDHPLATAPFVKAISQEHLSVEVRPSGAAPTSPMEWAGFDCVVLADQPASSLSMSQQEDLASYVHDAGGGLLVLGGPESYGAGGWIGSPLEDSLPIYLDPPSRREMPKGALVLIIDRSGSMSSPVNGTSLIQQQIANEAAVIGMRSLSRLDEISVIAFDDVADVVVALSPAADRDGIERRIRAIGPRGGTNLFPALDAAERQLAASEAGSRHIIVLSDGQTSGDPADGIERVNRLKAAGISLSTIAIGDESNDSLLARLARTGGGSFYSVASERSKAILPQIFIKEAKTIRRNLLWEGADVAPIADSYSESLAGLGGPFPNLTGYVVTAPREGLATLAMKSPSGDPILAQWQRGLGRVTAYTSDAAARWNAAWISWGAYERFWQQQVKWVMRPCGDDTVRMSTKLQGSTALVSVDLTDSAGERLHFAKIQARLAPPRSGQNDQPARDIAFRQVGPGRYEARFDVPDDGAHMLSMQWTATASGEARSLRRGTARTAIIRRGGEEFREPLPSQNLLWNLAQSSGGRIYKLTSQGEHLWVRDHLKMPERSLPVWPALLSAMCVLFLGDVAARRITLDPSRIGRWIRSGMSTGPVRTNAATAALLATHPRLRNARTPQAESSNPSPSASSGSDREQLRACSESESTSTAASVTPAQTSDAVLDRLRDAKKRARRDG